MRAKSRGSGAHSKRAGRGEETPGQRAAAQSPRSGSDGSAPAPAAEPGGGPALEPGLHLLSTPIGAARDLTLRGRDALLEADLLAAEDTRVLRKLMDLHGVSLRGRPLVAYHDQSGEGALGRLLDALRGGARVVYAADAGTPLVSDPGFRLVSEARALGVAVRALPGPSALLAALVVSGLPPDRFAFCGFPPSRRSARLSFFEEWRSTPATLAFYEAPRRLAGSLEDMAAVFGARPAAMARELTKRHEEVLAAPLPELAAMIAARAAVKGEVVVLVDRAPPAAAASDAEIDAALREAEPRLGARDAVAEVAARLGAPKRRVYGLMIGIKSGTDKEQ